MSTRGTRFEYPIHRRTSLGVALGTVVALALGCEPAPGASGRAVEDDPAEWTAYGRDAGGTRYSPLARIHRGNVSGLEVAWTFRTGDATHADGSEGPQAGCAACHTGSTKFETTPILADGRLYISTPLNRVLALDPERGTELWRWDPQVKTDIDRNEGFTSRGVSYWASGEGSGICARRILFGTIDARLVALDAGTGEPCPDFGEGGTVRLDVGVGEVREGMYGVTSPPAVVGDVVVVGSSIGDRWRADIERGNVRGYDVRTGALLWDWDPIPRSPEAPGWETWSPEAAAVTGTANAWAPLSADPERDLVFVPTGAAVPDFYGGLRGGENLYTSSVVALRASTGEVVWHYQVVHHDIWDYDVPAQPTLITVPRDGRDIPAVAVATKMGFVFILDRETGEPLFEVEERPVPQTAVAGETPWPTQPFPVRPPPLIEPAITIDDMWGPTLEDEQVCRDQFAAMRHDGIYTPPSLEGTVMFPGFGGAINWGGLAWGADRDVIVVNVNRFAMYVRLEDRPAATSSRMPLPYSMSRGLLASPAGLPCSGPPWGELVAIGTAEGDIRWRVPLGQVPALAGVEGSEAWGSITFGGPIVTAGGLVFIGATMDDAIRAFDADSGEELWKAELPAGGQATPMTYEVNGRQYIVIAAGGHGNLGTTFGDYVVAWALPREGDGP